MLVQAMQEVYPLLKAALETSMTQDVIAKAQQEGEEMIFFDDFLGDGDVDSHNRSVVRTARHLPSCMCFDIARYWQMLTLDTVLVCRCVCGRGVTWGRILG